MDYILNNMAFTSSFLVPAAVSDQHLKLASGNQIKVLLYFLRNVSGGIKAADISAFLKLPEEEVKDALQFWAQAGILVSIGAPVNEVKREEKPKVAKPVTVKPTREEISAIAFTDEKLSFLLSEAEMKLARTLRGTEMQTLAWLYLDHGMDVSIILMLVEYAVSEGKTTIAFIESIALSWLEAGVTTLTDAEEQIEARTKKKTAWGMVEAAFGIEHRMPSDKELEYANTWVIEWGFSREMLKEAYNRCVDAKAKLDMRYVNGILSRWFKDGIKTVEATRETEKTAAKKPADKKGFSAYDKSLVDKLLNNDD
ncbi:MAG: DnaD domain protein [Clostridia bacterium]|nr:DnaD domain protein [Clostridia bacterium]